MRKLYLSLCLAFSTALTCAPAALAASASKNSNNDFILGVTSGLLPLNNQPMIKESGGPLMIQIWASWCNRCSSLFAELATFAVDHPGLSFLAVSIDKNPKDASAYLIKHAAILSKIKNLPIASDSQGILAERFQIKSVPEVLLLNADGTILAKLSGHFTKKDLFEMSTKLKQREGATH